MAVCDGADGGGVRAAQLKKEETIDPLDLDGPFRCEVQSCLEILQVCLPILTNSYLQFLVLLPTFLPFNFSLLMFRIRTRFLRIQI